MMLFQVPGSLVYVYLRNPALHHRLEAIYLHHVHFVAVPRPLLYRNKESK